MDLSSKLSKFQQQHDRVQSTLIEVEAKRSKKKKAAATPPAASASGLAAAEEATQNIANLTFANDKEKLQQIAMVRKSPVMGQVKRVIELLLRKRAALLPEEINNLCFVDVANNAEVRKALMNNVKVHFDGQRYSYKAKHDLQNKADLLKTLRRFTEGMSLSELKDAYPAVVSDVQELKASGEIRVLTNSESQEEILYPDDPKAKIKVDEDVRRLVRGVELPKDFINVEKELIKVGFRPMTDSAGRRERLSDPGSAGGQQGKSKKKKKTSKRTKYTNVHLPELFQQLPPDMQ